MVGEPLTPPCIEKRGHTNVTNRPIVNLLTNVNCKSGKAKTFLTISPVLPCLPAIPKRQKLQHRSHSTLSSVFLHLHFVDVSETEMPPCPGVNLEATENGLIQVRRTQKEREKCPDRLHLDRRGLAAVPHLVDEKQLRFLSLQHNQLTRVENLSALSNLVFLDLYDNNLEKISGISELTNLRVLLMGKNRIRCINGLNTLSKLEVLDLHGNQVAEMNGLIGLRELKVLNLASNLIRMIRNNDLKGLQALQEINLRKNKLRSIACFEASSQLTKLYLSNNDIQRLDDLSNIVTAVSLREVTIDGNPVSLSGECIYYLVSHLPNLQFLSTAQVTEDMRKAAASWRFKKYGQLDATESNDALHKVGDVANKITDNDEEEQVKLPPLWGGMTWNESDEDTVRADQAKGQSQLPGGLKTNATKPKQKPAGGDYLIEINGRVLSVYGQGALRFIDRPWNPAKAGDVTMVKFNSIAFNNVALALSKLKLRFQNAEHFLFTETNIHCLGQLNALSDVQGLTSLSIEPQGNPICEKEWRSYAIYRLSHWGLKVINNVQITEAELVASESQFNGLSELVITCLPDSLLEPLLERLHLGQSMKDPRLWLQSAEPAIRSVVAKEALQWKKNKQEDGALKQKGKTYLYSIIHSAVSAIQKLRLLREEWPAILHEIIRDTLVDYSHIDTYMKQSMSQIKL